MTNTKSLHLKFSRVREYWSELSFPSPGESSWPRTELRSSALQADSLPPEPPGKSMRETGNCIRASEPHPFFALHMSHVRQDRARDSLKLAMHWILTHPWHQPSSFSSLEFHPPLLPSLWKACVLSQSNQGLIVWTFKFFQIYIIRNNSVIQIFVQSWNISSQ